MNVFIDTSGLYAVLDADDEKHDAARAAWVGFLEGTNRLTTSNYVLVETIALLQCRIGMECVNAFTADVLPVLDVIWVDEGIHRSAHHALLISSRRALSLVDVVSFEVMRRLDLRDVFCFDSHFAEQGFHVLPALH
jgi:predicted nucleic acid-binding protein